MQTTLGGPRVMTDGPYSKSREAERPREGRWDAISRTGSTEAEQLLGGETGETDFLESSDWPLSSLDLHLSFSASVSSLADCLFWFNVLFCQACTRRWTFDPRRIAMKSSIHSLCRNLLCRPVSPLSSVVVVSQHVQ